MKGGIGIKQKIRLVPAGMKRYMLALVIVFSVFCAPASARADPLPLPEQLAEISSPAMVVAGGQSIGVMMNTEGLTVVGFSALLAEDGSTHNPAEQAGLRIGDFIIAVNDEAVSSNQQIAAVIEAAALEGGNCRIDYLRNGAAGSAEMSPRLCQDTHSWRIGLYVRDNTAGVGTLTFYDPQSYAYAALGHTVSDLQYGVDDGELGRVIRASVQSIRPGTAGAPGEKLGAFLSDQWQGAVLSNGLFGIYGYLDGAPQSGYSGELLPVAQVAQVQEGPARIYTVLEGENVEAFDINIVKIMENYKSSGRGMIIEVVDSSLIEAAGGIVQGMSGSPIIQNNMLAGAVTHVFVNDPLHGYACFAQWMLEEAQATVSR